MIHMESEDGLERRLRQAYQAVPDHGFTARVLGALPAPASAKRLPILAGMTLAGGILGLVILPGGRFLHQVAGQLAGVAAMDLTTCCWLLAADVLAWALALAWACERAPKGVTAR